MTTSTSSSAPAGQITLGPYARVLFLGGNPLLRALCAWAKQNAFPAAVVTSPRHGAEIEDGVSFLDFLKASGIPHIVAESLDTPTVAAFIGETKDTFCLSVSAPWIFKPATIDKLFAGRLFNIHGAGLPRDRGGGGFSWQIMAGNRIGYGSLHVVDAGVDTGAIVHLEEFLFPHAARAPADYFAYAYARYVAFLGEILLKARSGSVSFAALAQPEHVSTYWPRLHTETHGWIDWGWEAAALERFICAFDDPYAGAQTTWNGTKVHLKKASLHLQDGIFHPYQAGVVYRKALRWMCVAAAGGNLIVERVVAGDGADLFDTIKVGDVFSTPQADLDKSRQRIAYTAKGLKGA